MIKSGFNSKLGHVINTHDTDLKLDAEQTRLYEVFRSFYW